ncbi:hypothetical protein OG226_03155 [Streptomyces sp. NBC_01261]|nr:hypothetical protein [Streptomyces sp. NBC_01261]
MVDAELEKHVPGGAALAVAEHPYTHAVLDRTPLPPDWALQVPSDYSSPKPCNCSKRTRNSTS